MILGTSTNTTKDANTIAFFKIIQEPLTNESTEALQQLIVEGIHLHANDSHGYTPLERARQIDNIAIVQRLLDAWIMSNAQNHNSTPLHWAIQHFPQMVPWLLERRINIDAQDNQGNTALHEAMLQNSTDIAQLLLEKGAIINILNKLGKSPLMIAIGTYFHQPDDLQKIMLTILNKIIKADRFKYLQEDLGTDWKSVPTLEATASKILTTNPKHIVSLFAIIEHHHFNATKLTPPLLTERLLCFLDTPTEAIDEPLSSSTCLLTSASTNSSTSTQIHDLSTQVANMDIFSFRRPYMRIG
ncbi:ankyrin repeat domain-containing protein [Candidatus Berkiella aquae]|uniref:Ankyrin repeat domain-containing protein n=1 Tax=Candidatus Berkiella aquae TaxID=295108 RepID=A0A0Q9YNX6_9GAMM|nr:ankyrin repeat domain-containing protein [Candidatus Berkiella aquae]MCS5711644.1 ankyrin repeat domain-containing protein [Candidatus Berkiella aquae]